jgi:hypothetical protein
MNKEWHYANPMPQRATMAQRVEWHLQHQLNCACRPIPPTVQRQIEENTARPRSE